MSLSSVTEHLAQTCNFCIPGLAGIVCQMADQNANDFYPTLCFFPKDGNSCSGTEPSPLKANFQAPGHGLMEIWQMEGFYELGRGEKGKKQSVAGSAWSLLEERDVTWGEWWRCSHWDVLPVLLKLWTSGLERKKEKKGEKKFQGGILLMAKGWL